MSEIGTYPLLFDPKIKELYDLAKMDFAPNKTLPTIDEIQKTSVVEKKYGDLIQIGILDKLNDAVNVSEEDYFKVTYPKWTDDIVLNNMIEEDIGEYHKIRVYEQATQISDCIDGLIQLDGYPKEMVGAYKKLYDFIRASPDKFERTRALNQLRIIAKSIIPPNIKFEHAEVVEPSLLAKAPNRGGVN